MSIRHVPTLVCDGCGTTITHNFYHTLRPTTQKVVQPHKNQPADRHFCCEACAAWWHGQFPSSGPWGPAWDERDWWCEHVGPCAESVHVVTVTSDLPLINNRVRLEDPEAL